ncbi:MAG TPA: hypothetical protein VD838_17720 [Anaeromyxobacteraceae bacterium]|nr:hypothetical protein [Anaeromyxobacteraceae bacterium]
MPETMSPVEHRTQVPEFLRKPMTAIQTRVDALEVEARRGLGDLLQHGSAGLQELDQFLDRVAREDWTMAGVRRRIQTLRSRAENAGTSALRRFDEMPGAAVAAIASASRARVQDLSRGLSAIARRIEVPAPAEATPARPANGA